VQAFTRSVFDLFSPKKRYLVPMFQRPYVWGLEKQWEPLWEDIRNKAQEHLDGAEAVDPHFLGAIVINQVLTFGASIPAHEVIDGQQRLTTFQLFLAAFRDLSRNFGDEDVASDLATNTLNTGKKAVAEEEYKVWPTRADQDAFTHCLKAGGRTALEAIYPPIFTRRKLQPRHKMVDAYLFFESSLRDFIMEGSEHTAEERIQAVFNALQNSLQLVSIELETKDDPQVIFETLNARGEPLLSSDLLRNFIFLRAKRQNLAANLLYDTYWQHFDVDPAEDGNTAAPFWKIEEQQGRLLRPRLDLFIQHFLSLKTGKDVNVGRLFHDYKRWIESERPYANVEDELKELNRYSKVFATFFVADKGTRLGKFLLRFQRLLDTNTIFPFLLYLEADSGLVPNERAAILKDLESFLVRRIVCGLTEKAYNLLFLQLMRNMRELPAASHQKFREMLLELQGESRYWPMNDEFHKAWLAQPIYRSSKSQGRVEAMLRAIEDFQINGKGENIHILGTLTIEHVMPQSWEDNWPLPVGKDPMTARVERDTLLHTFGNLTLLTQKLNAAVSNGAYVDKRPAIALQSKLGLNTHFQTCMTWDEDAIRSRGEQLYEVAQREWPYPVVSSATDDPT
jgi:uncharacterized protein with ParB-like and HNH nuclease domain